MKTVKTCTIAWSPLSQKHKDYIKQGFVCEKNCAEGAIRSGKTIDNCIIAADHIDKCEDLIHLATGSTIANAKMNIGDCNGFGLEHLFRGRCRWGVYRGNEALYVRDYKNRMKVVVFAGGGKADSYKKILGNSYGLWIATEINLHYDSDDSETSFIKVAMGRQIAAKQPKLLWDLNPSSPNHKIYKDYIDKWREQGLVNYEHFTINDNLTISEERKEAIKRQYDPDSVWYRRDILGLRVVAEGLIYRTFADKPHKFTLTKEQFEKIKDQIVLIECGIDFGGNGSAHTFVASAYTKFLKDQIVLKSVRLTGEYSPDQLNKEFVVFCQEIYNKYGKGFDSNYDNAEPVLARGLKNAAMKSGCRTNVLPAFKNPILQRIRLLLTLISQGRFWVLEGETDTVVNAISNAQWDPKHPDTRLDNGTSDIDTMDALEYSSEKHTKELLDQSQSLIKEILENGLLGNSQKDLQRAS